MFTLFLFFLAQRMPGKWICAFLRALPALTWLPVLCIVRDIWMSAGHVSFKVIARGAAEWKSEEQSQRGEEGGHNPKRIGSSPPYTHTHTHLSNSLHTVCVCVSGGDEYWMGQLVSWLWCLISPSLSFPLPPFIVCLLNERGRAEGLWLTPPDCSLSTLRHCLSLDSLPTVPDAKRRVASYSQWDTSKSAFFNT